jgi:hypothetical protein
MPNPRNEHREPSSSTTLAWLARFGAVLLGFFLVYFLSFHLLHGIYTGVIEESTKHGKVIYSREASPISFWFTVGFDATVALVIGGYFEYLCLVKAGWIENKESIDVIVDEFVAWVNAPSKPIPLWFAVVALGGFFYFLYTLFPKV